MTDIYDDTLMLLKVKRVEVEVLKREPKELGNDTNNYKATTEFKFHDAYLTRDKA